MAGGKFQQGQQQWRGGAAIEAAGGRQVVSKARTRIVTERCIPEMVGRKSQQGQQQWRGGAAAEAASGQWGPAGPHPAAAWADRSCSACLHHIGATSLNVCIG